MLKHTFCHIPGIGLKTEKRLWNSGIRCWDDVCLAEKRGPRSARDSVLEQYVPLSIERCESRDIGFFGRGLPTAEEWRAFRDFRNDVVFLDIETTGLSKTYHEVTTIALYDGRAIRHYVNGENLDEFVGDIEKYKLIVTYNGKSFDVPFLEAYFGMRLRHYHIDLRYVLRSLGYSGGLKGCEKQLGLSRGDLEGVDGYFAVVLWKEYRKSRNREALETLLAYNIEDVVNLEKLMIVAYNEKLRATPFFEEDRIAEPQEPARPFSPSLRLIRELQNSLYNPWAKTIG